MEPYDTYLAHKARLGLPPPSSTPVDAGALSAWELKWKLALPDDLKAFLLAYGDGAAGFALKNGPTVTREFSRLLEQSDAALTAAARPCHFGAKGWLPRMPAHGPGMDLGFMQLKVDKSMVSKLNPRTVTDGCLTLGETMDGSFWMLALNGKARGKVFVWNAEYDYEGMRPTRKTFGQLMALWLERANSKLAQDVALIDLIDARGAEIWQLREPEEVMQRLRGLLHTASSAALPKYLALALSCDALGPLDGWPNATTQELIWGLSSLMSRGETGVLVSQLANSLESHGTSHHHSRQLFSDFVTMTLLADAADGTLELGYRAAYPRVEGVLGLPVRRVGEECAAAFRALDDARQRLVLEHISPSAMLSMSIGGMVGHLDDVIARHPTAMRALAMDLFRDIAATPTSLAGAHAVAELSRAVFWQLKKAPDCAALLTPWLPLLAHGASLLQTPESYSAATLGKGLGETVETLCKATGTPQETEQWRREFEAELAAPAR